MRKLAPLLLWLFANGGPIWAQSVAGHWLGTLKVGNAELRMEVHFTREGGKLRGTLDSLDQGANGIPIDSISLTGNKLHFFSSAISCSYNGTVSADARRIDGTWIQGQQLPLQFARLTKAISTEEKPGKPSDIDGSWEGPVGTGSKQMRVAFHIKNMEDGLTAKMDIPGEGANGIPATQVERRGPLVTIQLKQMAAELKATLSGDRNTLTGNWLQNGNSLPVMLKRVKEDTGHR